MDNHKYVNSESQEGVVAHCPACRGVILKRFKVHVRNGGLSFTARCPHCEADILIEWTEPDGLNVSLYPHCGNNG